MTYTDWDINIAGQPGEAPAVASSIVLEAQITAPQANAGGAWTAIIFNSVITDTQGAYNPTTGVYTPKQAGVYAISATAFLNATGTNVIGIFKNGAQNAELQQSGVSGASWVSVSGLVHCNGTTDNFSIQGYLGAAGSFFGSTSIPVNVVAALLQTGPAGPPGIQGPAGASSGYVNKFRNGTFDIWQRGTSIAYGGGSVINFTADGWTLATNISTTVSAAPGRLLTNNSLQIAGGAGVANMAFDQRIESFLASGLAGQNCTLQYWMQNNTPAPITPQMFIYQANAQDNFSAVTLVFENFVQTVQPGQWGQLAYTFAMPATANLGVYARLGLTGQVSSGNVRIAEADIRATPTLPIGLCSNPPPAELRAVANELLLCQRYFETYYGWGSGNSGFFSYATAAGQLYEWNFKIRKRAIPSYGLMAGASWANAPANFYPGLDMMLMTGTAAFYLNGPNPTLGPSFYVSAEL